MSENPLLSDREVEFVLYEVLAIESLCALPAFAEHSRETFDLFLQSTRRLARETLYPAYRIMDADPPRFADNQISVHPIMKTIYPKLVELGLISATRPFAVGGQQLPMAIFTLAEVYLSAANLSALGFAGLTAGAAHLLETFGSEWLKSQIMPRLYSGEWTGTMALTEPQAGSSLADVETLATPSSKSDGSYAIRGNKIFISAGDHDLTDNIVHLVLARIEGAPPGSKGISLFAVPKRRLDGDRLISNDVTVTGAIHKIGWRGLPSLALSFGDHSDCRGWLVGEPHRGLTYMFQMMNEARILVGASGVGTASVAYQQAVAYAKDRPQGRALERRASAAGPQIAIIEHADVRRMLLRQKAIVEGGLLLVTATARYADLSQHAASDEERRKYSLLLDLLTPVAKSFPAERGFESNALALQIHGGYGYSSEYLPEAWLRDQKLNTIHEGTTGIQGLDLLGRKVVAAGGAALGAFGEEVRATIARARAATVEESWCAALEAQLTLVTQLTAELAGHGLAGDAAKMLLHSADYLELFSILVVAWLWLEAAAAAHRAVGVDEGFYAGQRYTAQYWLHTELPRITQLVALCSAGDDSYAQMQPDWF